MSAHRPLVAGLAEGLRLRATAVVFVAAVVLPLIVHLLPPWHGVLWGERLLPMFYAPLIGVAFFPLHVGLIPVLLAPFVNGILTGLPDGNLVFVLTAELSVFTLLSNWALARRLWFGAPLAYVVAKACAWGLMLLLPFLRTGAPDVTEFLESLKNSIPGIALLLVVNVVLLRRHATVDHPV